MKLWNKKGFFGMSPIQVMTIIFMFIIGLMVVGPVAQELRNMVCYNNTNGSMISDAPSTILLQEPEGQTDSFGGAGSNRFGGYDNKVTHKSFTEKIASTSIIKTDKSILNPDCVELDKTTTFFVDNFIWIYLLCFGLILITSNRMFSSYGSADYDL
jgi:hypothetical protein